MAIKGIFFSVAIDLCSYILNPFLSDLCLKIQKNAKNSITSDEPVLEIQTPLSGRKSLLVNSSQNQENYEDFEFSSDFTELDPENLAAIFEEFKIKNHGSEFSGEKLLSYLNHSTTNEMISIRLATKMAEIGLFEEISKKRRSFLETISRDSFSPTKFYRAQILDQRQSPKSKQFSRTISEVTPSSPFTVTLEGSRCE